MKLNRSAKYTSVFSIIFLIIFSFLFLNKQDNYVKAASIQATLVRTIDTSLWSPNSPDPSGITYKKPSNTFVVVDGEVDEMPAFFTGKNTFEMRPDGSLLKTHTTTVFSNEPTDIGYNRNNKHYFVSDDNKKIVYDVNPGSDLIIGTSDDSFTSFSTSAFGNTDPEGLTFFNNTIYLTDGVNAEVFVIKPGPNGVFDGVTPAGDDIVTHFDTLAMGQPDPEGIEYNTDKNTLYIVSNNGGKAINKISETSLTGTLLNEIDISFLGARSTAGLAYGPGSINTTVNNLYIVARGVDNNSDPNENDGKIYEISLSTPSSSTPTATASATPTVDPSATPTATPTTSPTATPTAQINLLLNSGFELDANGDNRPDNWTSKSFFTRSSTLFKTGSFSGRHSSTTNNGYTILQNVDGITEGSTYGFNGWTNIPSTSDTFSYKLQLRWLNSSGSALSTKTVKTYTVATAGWDQFSRNYVAPLGAVTAQIRMTVSSLNTLIYSDEFELKKL